MEKIKNSNNKYIQIIMKLVEKNTEFKLAEKSAVVVYYILLSIGPFLVFAFTIMTQFLSAYVETVVDFARGFHPGAGLIINPIIDYLSDTNNSTFAIVGAFTALFSASKAAKHIIKSFNAFFQIHPKSGMKSFILNNIYALVLTLALTLSLIVFFVLFVTGDPIASLINYLTGFDLTDYTLWGFLRSFVPVAYLFLLVTVIFQLLAKFGNGTAFTIKEAAIGGTFVTLGWVGGSLLFSFYINNFNNNNAIYGVLGSIMIIMLWFYILMYTLLLGAALIRAYIDVEEQREIDDIKRPYKKFGIQ